MMSKITGGGGGGGGGEVTLNGSSSHRRGKEDSGFDGLVSATAGLGLRDLLVEDDKKVSRAGLIVSSSCIKKKKDSGSGDGRPSTNVEEDERAGGTRVIVVGDDPLFLQDIKKKLQGCGNAVTTCSRAIDASSMLIEQENKFDIIASAFACKMSHLLLDNISQKTGLPLMTISRDVRGNLVIRCVRQGTRDYHIKPKRENGMEGSAEISPSVPRVVWSVQINRRFNVVLAKLGVDEAVPEKVLELMDAPGLTLEDVSSHLKDYRLRSKKMKDACKKMSEYRAKRSASVPHTKQAVMGRSNIDLLGMPFGDGSCFKWCAFPCDGNLGSTLKSSQGNGNLSPAFCGLQGSTTNSSSQKNEQQVSCDYMKENEHANETGSVLSSSLKRMKFDSEVLLEGDAIFEHVKNNIPV